MVSGGLRPCCTISWNRAHLAWTAKKKKKKNQSSFGLYFRFTFHLARNIISSFVSLVLLNLAGWRCDILGLFECVDFEHFVVDRASEVLVPERTNQRSVWLEASPW